MERVQSNNEVQQAVSLKYFDELASIHILQDDLRRHGQILPETWQQVANEELTFVAESINAPLKTRFILRQTPDGLVDERGTRLQSALERGVITAETAVKLDPRKSFNLQRIIHDYHEGVVLEQMMRGETDFNTVVSVSPFADEAYVAHRKQFVESLGFNADRKLAFVRIYSKTADDTLDVLTLSVDNSDLLAFQGLLGSTGVYVPDGTRSDDFLAHRAYLSLDKPAQAALPQRLLKTYDQAMQEMYGQEFNAGRPKVEEVEAWSFIAQQKDLVGHYFSKLERLARTDPDNLYNKRKLTYGFWAALKDRMKELRGGQNIPRVYDDPLTQYAALDRETTHAYNLAASRHEAMIACGGMLTMGQDSDLANVSPENALASIFGEKSAKLVWKDGICRIDGCPTRPSKTKVAQCHVCMHCQKLFDRGKDPAKEYKGRRDNAKNN